ncbi:hypothetical protein BpHYR1_016214 [Brachionus plicatilis]|uniref:Uncharacterized protein n=1 Tax=Brachionus plicatilis TaxID=10195 RepID=A0A3M7RHJ8_BRAPC|nr:hypothetical protein BpHYR1_016214 [Brachionus plicatilis]
MRTYFKNKANLVIPTVSLGVIKKEALRRTYEILLIYSVMFIFFGNTLKKILRGGVIRPHTILSILVKI